MPISIPAATLEKFVTFGDFLRFLRRRVSLTQIELANEVGYSDTQISRLEQNLRLPDLPTIEARFVPALGLEEEPKTIARLLELAANVRREDAPTQGLCPYKGLNFFDEADADQFMGRDVLTARLLERVLAFHASRAAPGPRFLAVVGASGSGKSSLVRAGLVAALRWNKASTDWHICVLTPTAHPLASLASALTNEKKPVLTTAELAEELARDARGLQSYATHRLGQSNGQRLLLVIDQFEELFALCHVEEERAAFIVNLLTAASEIDGPVILVITLRADFYAHCADYAELREALARKQEYIGAMSKAELRRAIEEPAKRGHWEIEPGLTDLLLHDVGQEPGALPLLSHALFETWQRRRGRMITLSGYTSSGGVRGAIAETAEAVFTDQFTPEQQTIARRIFLRLTELGDDTGAGDTRRRASFEELILRPEEALTTRAVLKALADARLITTSEEAAEVAHEALIREWPTLHQWLEANREGLRLHQHLTAAAQAWERLGRDPGELYRGARLAQAKEWTAAHPGELNLLEREFEMASEARANHEAREQEAQRQRELQAAQQLAEAQQRRAEEQSQAARRLRRRNRLVASAGLAALLLAVLAAVFGLQALQNARFAQNNLAEAQAANTQAAANAATAQAERARADVKTAEGFSRELAVQARLNLSVDPERSLLLALAGLDQADTEEAQNALHAAISASRVRLVLRGFTGTVRALAYSPDGRQIATGSDDSTIRLWDAASGVQVALFQHTAPIYSLQFAPDGARLVTGDWAGAVTIWNIASGRALLSFQAAAPDDFQDMEEDFLMVRLSPNGRTLATTVRRDRRVRFWDAVTGSELFALSDPAWNDVPPGADLGITDVAFSPDGARVALSLATVELGVDPDQGGVEIWDVAARKKLVSLAEQWLADLASPRFSPDGARLVTGRSADGRAAVWDAATGKLIYKLHEGANNIQFSADGRRLLAAAGGGVAKIFDAEAGDEILALAGHSGRVYAISEEPGCAAPPAAVFAWCGRHVATSSDDQTVRIWDASPEGNQEFVMFPSFDMVLNPAGTRLTTFDITTLAPNQPRLQLDAWDLQASSRPDEPMVQAVNEQSSQIDVGAGGPAVWLFQVPAILGARIEDGHYRFWDLNAGGRQLYDVNGCPDAQVGFSSQAVPRVALACVSSGTVEIWDPTVPAQVATLVVAYPQTPFQVVMSPHGKRLATIDGENAVQLWDTTTGQKIVDLAEPASLSIFSVKFSRDSRYLAVSDCAGTAIIRDATTGGVAQTLQANLACITGLDFSPDDRLVAVNSRQRGLIVWDWRSGRELAALPGGGNVQFTPDGRRLIATVFDQTGLETFTVRMFTLQRDELVALAKRRVTRSLTGEECRQFLHVDQCP